MNLAVNIKVYTKRMILIAVMLVTISMGLFGCITPKPTLNQLIAARYNECLMMNAYGIGSFYCSDVKYDENSFSVSDTTANCTGTVSEKFDEHLFLNGSVNSYWCYNEDDREWQFSYESYDIFGSVTANVEGSWKIYDSNKYILVKNQTDSGMDVYVEKYGDFGDDWVHVDLVTSADKDLKSLLNDDRCHAVYKGKNANGKIVTVTFFKGVTGKFGIEVHVPSGFIGSNSRHGYYNEYVPYLVDNP